MKFLHKLLKQKLFKPEWQSNDAVVRRVAVSESHDSALLALLPQLARTDADAGIRLAALKRLGDPGLAQMLACDDADAQVRTHARELYLDLMAGTHPAAPPLSERLRLLKAQDDASFFEHLAQHAPEAQLREAALQRVTRPALLAERVLTDPNAHIRLAVLERIPDEAQLERIAERARKTDKQISRRARERLEELRIARSDNNAIVSHARTLCERLEALLRNAGTDQELAEITQLWDAIAPQAPAEIIARYTAIQELVALSRDPQTLTRVRQQAAELIAIEHELERLDKELVAKIAAQTLDTLAERFTATGKRYAILSETSNIPTSRAEKIENQLTLLTQRFAQCAQQQASIVPDELDVDPIELNAQARFATSLAAANAAALREREQLRASEIELEQILQALEQSIDNGETALAHAAHERLVEPRKRLGQVMSRELSQRLAEIENRYNELAHWQRWSANQRRVQLCDEIEALIGSGLHPDAMASKAREAQAEWVRLDKAEGRTTEQPADGLTKRFRALRRRALEPAKPYFEKRDALRQSFTQEVITLLERAAAVPVDNQDWRALNKLCRDIAKTLSNQDSIAPRERKELAQRLKDALTEFNGRLNSHYEDIEKTKTKLIARSQMLTQLDDIQAATREARELQRQWQATGAGRRSRDTSQWKVFRETLDTIYAKLDVQRAERSAQEAEAQAIAEATCTEIEVLANSGQTLNRTALTHLNSRWEALHVRDGVLRGRYSEAQIKIQDVMAHQAHRQRCQRFETWLARYQLCLIAEKNVESPEVLKARWAQLPSSDIAKNLLEIRFNRALDMPGTSAQLPLDTESTARDVLIALEFLAGIESPQEDRQHRLDFQVARLAGRMRGEFAAELEDELTSLLEYWTALESPLTKASLFIERFEHALKATLKVLP